MITPQSLVDELSPSLRLVGLDDAERHFPAGGDRGVAVGTDGSFVLRQVPAGSWRVVLLAGRRHPTELATLRDLRPGETRPLLLDAGPLALGALRGRVQVNGEPVRRKVALITIDPDRGSARNHTTHGYADTDENGAFEVRAPEGEYRLMVSAGSADERRWMLSPDKVHVIAERQSSRDFSLTHRAAEFRLLEADGKTPVAGREMMVLWGTYVWPSERPVTDAAGRLVVDPLPPGPFSLATWPVHLAARDAQQAYQREHPETWPDVLITIGPVDLDRAVGRPRDLLLPTK